MQSENMQSILKTIKGKYNNEPAKAHLNSDMEGKRKLINHRTIGQMQQTF